MKKSFIMLALCALPLELLAGIVPCDHFYINEKSIDESDIYLGKDNNINICCTYSSAYISSGEHIGNIVYLLGNRLKLSNSVGINGLNKPLDVMAASKALKSLGIYKGEIASKYSSEIGDAIIHFQKHFAKLGNPDGKIDVNGHTHRHLNANLLDYIHNPVDLSTFRNCVSTKIESIDNKVEFGFIPWVVFGSSRSSLVNHIVNYGHIINWSPGEIILNENDDVKPREGFSTTLRINGKYPSKELVKSGARNDPVTFSWESSTTNPEVEFRYRLFPHEKWSPWGSSMQSTYTFIPRGAYVFQVQPRIRSEKLGRNVAEFQFVLEQPLTSKPLISKASVSSSGLNKNTVTSWYPRSVALLIGITNYDHFESFDQAHINNDINKVEEALRANGFHTITHVKSTLMKDDLLGVLEEFSRNLREDDRVIVYISSHGTEHPGRKSKGYIATTDCDPNEPRKRCVEINELVEILEERLVETGPRHLAIILDSCSSGLGVIGKESSEFSEISVAKSHGAHILTAGTENQIAFIDKDIGGSIFTFFLTQGLKGAADYTSDGVVTLQELSVYTRFHVAKFLQECRNVNQTPMLGRFWGSGEMVFRAKRENFDNMRYENECP